jgi:hypothetical protein
MNIIGNDEQTRIIAVMYPTLWKSITRQIAHVLVRSEKTPVREEYSNGMSKMTTWPLILDDMVVKKAAIAYIRSSKTNALLDVSLL